MPDSFRMLRLSKNKKQSDLWNKSVRPNTLHCLESGEWEGVRFTVLQSLAKSLGVSEGEVAEALLESRRRHLAGEEDAKGRVFTRPTLEALKKGMR